VTSSYIGSRHTATSQLPDHKRTAELFIATAEAARCPGMTAEFQANDVRHVEGHMNT